MRISLRQNGKDVWFDVTKFTVEMDNGETSFRILEDLNSIEITKVNFDKNSISIHPHVSNSITIS